MTRISAALALAVLSPLAWAQSAVTTVEVVANAATYVRAPVQSPPPYVLRIYRLDAMAQISQQLSLRLPMGEEQARAYMLQQQAQIRSRYQAQIVNAAKGMSLAIHYRLDRLPAVVVNRHAVVYGVADVDQAVGLYQQSKGRR